MPAAFCSNSLCKLSDLNPHSNTPSRMNARTHAPPFPDWLASLLTHLSERKCQLHSAPIAYVNSQASHPLSTAATAPAVLALVQDQEVPECSWNHLSA